MVKTREMENVKKRAKNIIESFVIIIVIIVVIVESEWNKVHYCTPKRPEELNQRETFAPPSSDLCALFYPFNALLQRRNILRTHTHIPRWIARMRTVVLPHGSFVEQYYYSVDYFFPFADIFHFLQKRREPASGVRFRLFQLLNSTAKMNADCY